MTRNLSGETLLTTTRSVRRRLDFDRPLDRRVVEGCLRTAFQAPNGSNLQRWNWVLVDDPGIRIAMGDIYRESLAEHLTWSSQAASHPSETPRLADDTQRRMNDSVMYLVEHIHEAPVLVVPTTAGRLEGASVFQQASVWGSILPAVWNLMLALRLEGLGSAWTTLHLYRERDMAELLGIPYERHTQAGLFPIAYTRGVDFGRADRSKSEATIRWNSW